MLNTLRELRLYHWRKAKAHRAMARAGLESHGATYVVKPDDQLADFHLRCVQVLNDVVSGNAEQDDLGIPSTEQPDQPGKGA